MSPLDYAERIAYSSKEVLRFTYDMAKKYADSPGVYVECGVAAGAQIIAMACATQDKMIYAFDSFEGIPLPSNKDNQMPGIRMLRDNEIKSLPDPGKQTLQSSGATSVSEFDFWQHIKLSGIKTNQICTVKGWFEETVINTHYINDILILRLDGDLYNSTYVCLKYLYPKVIKGACVIIDDIQLPGCKAACDDYFLSIGYYPDYKHVDNITYFIK